MKNFKELIREVLQYIPPNVSKDEYNHRVDKIKTELEKKTGLKYSHAGHAYNSDKQGNSSHLFMSEPFKREWNKKYGGSTSHHVGVTMNSNHVATKIDSVVSHQNRRNGEWENSDYKYHHMPSKNIDEAASHANITKQNQEEFPKNEKHSGTILHPTLFK